MHSDTPERARALHVPDESAAGRTVFAFDRDSTLDVCPPVDEGRDAVPLAWVAYLAHRTDHLVYAVGNQLLVREAAVPGLYEILTAHPDGSEPEEPFGPIVFDPDRRTRIRMLADLYPEADAYVAIDDVDLSDLDGWEHHFPWEFGAAARDGGVVSELPPDEAALATVGEELPALE